MSIDGSSLTEVLFKICKNMVDKGNRIAICELLGVGALCPVV
jgi:hypothetical protein